MPIFKDCYCIQEKKIEEKNLHKAHENACDDGKRILEDLFPDVSFTGYTYCCRDLKSLVLNLERGHCGYYLHFYSGSVELMKFCPFCGAKWDGYKYTK